MSPWWVLRCPSIETSTSGSFVSPLWAMANADDVDDDFDAAAAIESSNADGPGCGGIDMGGSKLDTEIDDMWCAAMDGRAMMLEEHGYCFDEDKQEWALCAATN